MKRMRFLSWILADTFSESTFYSHGQWTLDTYICKNLSFLFKCKNMLIKLFSFEMLYFAKLQYHNGFYKDNLINIIYIAINMTMCECVPVCYTMTAFCINSYKIINIAIIIHGTTYTIGFIEYFFSTFF